MGGAVLVHVGTNVAEEGTSAQGRVLQFLGVSLSGLSTRAHLP